MIRALRVIAAIPLIGVSSFAMADLMSASGQFEVSPLGSATYHMPIMVPPGTSGMAPSLSLTYDSNSPDGLLGVGWQLAGLPTITRCAQTLVQDGRSSRIEYSDNDRFCMEGQRLIVGIPGTAAASQPTTYYFLYNATNGYSTNYRTEIESYNLVKSSGTAGNFVGHAAQGNGPAWFEVRTRSGQVMQLGNTADSQILAQGKYAGSVWAVNRVTDTKGNYFTVTYTNDAVNGQYYPTRIDYTGNSTTGLATYASVQFTYETRTDAYPLYRGGSFSKLTQRLTHIKTFVGTTMALDYQLAYQYSPASGNSRLISVTICGNDGSCLPATTFSYSGASGNPTYSAFSTWMTAPGAIATSIPSFGDVNGDGRADVLINNNGAFWLSLATGTGFTAPVNTGITGNAPVLADFYGLGRTDLLAQNATGQILVYPSTGTGFGTGFVAFDHTIYAVGNGRMEAPSVLGNNYSPLYGDIDGDGRVDLVYHDAADNFFYTLSGGSISVPNRTTFGGKSNIIPNSASFPLVCKADETACLTTLAGVTGTPHPKMTAQIINATGRANGSDLVIMSDTSNLTGLPAGYPGIKVWHALWQGSKDLTTGNMVFWQPVQKMVTIPASGALPTIALLNSDVNGDGLNDIYLATSTGTQSLYISNGNGFNAAVTPGLAASSCPNSIEFVDLFGSGRTDAICGSGTSLQVAKSTGAGFGALASLKTLPALGSWWFADVNGDARTDIVTIDSSNHYQVATWTGAAPARPDLLTSITTGIGATTAIAYDVLTHNPSNNGSTIYTKGTSGVYPSIDIQDAINVVTRVDGSNGIGGTYSSGYTYAGARIDGSGRGFVGFQQVAVKDLQTNIVTTTSYKQAFPYIGLIDTVTTSLGAQNLSQSVNTYASTFVGGANASGGLGYFAYLQKNVASSWELSGTALPVTTTTYQYDGYGNPTQIVVSTPDGYTKTTNNTYIQNNGVTLWIMGRLTRSTVTSTTP